MFLYSFDKNYFLECVENWWIRKSQREHFSYKWIIDRPVYWDSLVAQLVKNPNEMQGNWFHSWIRNDPGEGISYPLQHSWASLVSQMVKNQSAMNDTWVRSLGWENPLEKGMATHSSVLPRRIPMDIGAWQVTVHWVTKSWTDWASMHSTSTDLLGLISESYCPEKQLLIALTPSFNMSGFMHELGERLSWQFSESFIFGTSIVSESVVFVGKKRLGLPLHFCNLNEQKMGDLALLWGMDNPPPPKWRENLSKLWNL